MAASLTIGTSTITVARDSAQRTMPFMDGGEDPQTVCQVLCNASDVLAINPTPRILIGTVATMDGQNWRIDELTQGPSGTRIMLKEIDQ